MAAPASWRPVTRSWGSASPRAPTASNRARHPNGTQVADGYYHPEDEVFMPWFMRLNPSTSQAVQSGTGGRYTLMGSLNPYDGFKMPATGC
jgi:hypothetical protein